MPPAGLILVAALLAASFAARPAMAADGTLNAFAPEDLYIGVQHPDGRNLGDAEVRRFFNRANCDCSEPVTLYFTFNEGGLAKLDTLSRNGQLQIWIGTACDDVNQRQSRCLSAGAQPLSRLIDDGHLVYQTNARVLSTEPGSATGFPAGGNPTCTSSLQQYAQMIYAFIDTDGDGAPDVTSTRAVLIDLTPPPAPNSDGISLEGGNEGLSMRWPKIDTTLYPDLRGYQILCNRGGALQVFKEGSFDPFYQSCPASVAAGGGGVTGLDPLFVCSPLLSPSTTSHRIKILQNDIVYGAAVVAIDESGNASTPDIFYAAPGATESFYDQYRAPGTEEMPGPPGAAQGGFCAVTTEAASERATSTSLLFAGMVLLAYRRRRRGTP